jgi:predicted nucleotidyltransferase component of viral defense system
MSIKPLSSNILELIKDEFDINPSFAEKDWYAQHILGVIANFQSDEFQPIFSGGTSLSKGYQLIQRFSEDIDFRVRPLKEQVSRSIRSNYQDRLVDAILASSPDLQLARDVYKRDRSTFLKCQIAYPSQFTGSSGVRQHIQIELTFDEPIQLEPEIRPLSSLVNQFTQQPPEIAGMPCLNLAETAADKLAALSWRLADRDPRGERYDPRVIRHVYDLAYLAPRIRDNSQWAKLTLETIARDIKKKRAKNPDGSITNPDELIRTPTSLMNELMERFDKDNIYQEHYRQFVEDFAYGESLSFDRAVESLSDLTKRLVESEKTSNLQQRLNADLIIKEPNSSSEELKPPQQSL